MAPNRRNKRLLVIDYSGNPTHNGHLRCGKWMVNQAGFDHVFYAVSGSPATKSKTEVLDPELRHEFAVAATAQDKDLSACRVNLHRAGMSWALTAVEGVQELYPNASVSFGISGEYLDPDHRFWLKRWIGADHLFKSSVATVFPRAEQSVEQLRAWAKLVPEARIEVFYAPASPLSATQIRDLLACGRSIRYLAPDAMVERVYSSGAYREAATPLAGLFNPFAAVASVAVFLADFDPITLADLRRAEVLRESHCFDRVEFLPIAGFRDGLTAVAPAELRYEMAVAATASNPFFRASRLDIERACVSSPYFSLADMCERYGHSVKMTVLCEADWLDPSHQFWLGRWFGVEALFRMCRFVAMANARVSVEQAKRWAKALKGASIEVVAPPGDSVGAGEVRDFVLRGLPLAYSVPAPVENIIAKSGLYRAGSPWTAARIARGTLGSAPAPGGQAA